MELKVTPETLTPGGTWVFGAVESSVTANALPAHSKARPYFRSRRASQLQVCGSNGSGFGLTVLPSLDPV